MERAFRWMLAAIVLACFHLAEAQQPSKVSLIGYLANTASGTRGQIEAFRQGLRELGRIEGQNTQIEYRYIEGQQHRVPDLIGEFLRLNADVLVLSTLTSIRAAKQATTTIPVVIVMNGDPVAAGVIDSLARPGGNITGVARLTRELNGKRLEMLKQVIPGISSIAVLWDANGPGPAGSFKEYESVGRSLHLKIQSHEFRGPDPDWEGIFERARKSSAGAVIAVTSSVPRRHMRRIAELAIKHRLPYMSEASEYVEAGSLMSYSGDNDELFRRAATYVDKILKGAKPAELPIEQASNFELVINLKTAKQIGLTVPPPVLSLANEVIR
jgi:putative ABC transport system substrate-binding protein